MLAGYPLVLGLDRQLMLGGGVVEARGGQGNGVQVDGLDGAVGWENSPGPGRPDWSAVRARPLLAVTRFRNIIRK